MIIVTGGAGFIGSNIVAGLNARGEERVLVVDNLSNTDKIKNLSDLHIQDYLDKAEFRKRVLADESFGSIEAIFHQGACSDTMQSDGRYVLDNNFQYSKELLAYCAAREIPFIYASSASVYGDGRVFAETLENEKPLNAYAYSKWLFDCYVRRQSFSSQVVGLRYFNVYGPREQHKGRMASVAYHFFHQFRESGGVRLFEGTDGYARGEQRRDFIYVDDVVKVNMFFLEHPDKSGVFNAGTGASGTFNDVARAVISYSDNATGSVEDSHSVSPSKVIEYIELPAKLKGKYQSFTEADMSALRAVGYQHDFADVDAGVGQYVEFLKQSKQGLVG